MVQATTKSEHDNENTGPSHTGGGHGIKPMGTAALTAFIFFEVAGSPAGAEEIIGAAGPLLTLIGFVVMPLIWCLPEGLVTAELATMYPEDSGYVAWVTAAMGEFWGFMEGVLKWLAGVTDNAVYPLMIANYAKTMFPSLHDPTTYHIFLVVCIVVLTALNYCGLKVVGWTSIVLLVMCLFPFFLMAAIGIPQMEPHRLIESKPLNEVDWGLFLNALFWNLNGFDAASTVAAEVQNPQVTFPRALKFAGLLVAVQYFFPVLVGIGVTASVDSWDNNGYAHVAKSVAGVWLRDWIVFAVAISSVGLFEAEMSGDSFQLLGMAERGMIPKLFMRRSRFGTPTFGIMMSAVALSLCAFLSLERIIELLNILYVWAFVLQALALVILRVKRPNAHRPYRVPLGVYGLVVLFMPAMAYVITVMRYASTESHIVTALSLVFAVCLYWVMRWMKSNNLVQFVHKDDNLLLPKLTLDPEHGSRIEPTTALHSSTQRSNPCQHTHHTYTHQHPENSSLSTSQNGSLRSYDSMANVTEQPVLIAPSTAQADANAVAAGAESSIP